MTIPMNDHPILTAIVYAHGAADLLRRKLESLCAQTLAQQAFEVVVVDDGSAAVEPELVAAFERRLPLRHVRPPRPGRLAARNHGIFVARGELLLFLDDDAVATPGLLDAHRGAHRRLPQVTQAVLGATEIDPSIAMDPLVQFVTEVEGFPLSYRDLQDGDLLDFTCFWAARSSCKRALLLEHGPFSADLDPVCADLELGYRLSRAGFQLSYCPHARMTRVMPLAFEAHRLERYRLGVARRELDRLHPAEPLQRWTRLAEAASLWRKVAPAYDALVRSARELDRIVRLRQEAGLAVDPSELALLHRAYWTVFRSSTARGAGEGIRGAVPDPHPRSPGKPGSGAAPLSS